MPDTEALNPDIEVLNEPAPLYFISWMRRLSGYSGPLARVLVDGVEKDIYHHREYGTFTPDNIIRVYNQADEFGEPALSRDNHFIVNDADKST